MNQRKYLGQTIDVVFGKNHGFFIVPRIYVGLLDNHAFDGFCRLDDDNLYVHWDKFNVRALRKLLDWPMRITQSRSQTRVKAIQNLGKLTRPRVEEAA